MAPDTSGDGTGCDNMTCMIVSFEHISGKVITSTGAAKRRASDQNSQSDAKKLKPEENPSCD